MIIVYPMYGLRNPLQNLLVANTYKDEVGKRYSFFYVIGCVASAFGGILAYGLMQMSGLSNLAGWRCKFDPNSQVAV
jgi:MFS family permease